MASAPLSGSGAGPAVAFVPPGSQRSIPNAAWAALGGVALDNAGDAFLAASNQSISNPALSPGGVWEVFADGTADQVISDHSYGINAVAMDVAGDLFYADEQGNLYTTGSPVTGTIKFSYQGTTSLGAAYGPTGQAPKDAGSYTVTATLAGDPLYQGSQSGTLVIAPAP